MIYHNFNFEDSFSNAVGNRRNTMVLGELGKVINEHPQEVIVAIEDADISVPKGATKKQLIKLILNNKRNPQLISNLSLLIFANTSSFDGGRSVDYEFTGRASVMKGVDGSTSGEDKTQIFKQIGDWIKKRREQKATQDTTGDSATGEKGQFWKKISGFFKKNKSKIGDISTSLADGLGDKNNSTSTLNNSVNNANAKATTNTTNQAKPMSNTTKAILFFGAIGLVAFYIYKKQK